MNKNTFLFFTCVLSAYQCGMIKASEYKSTVLNTPIPQKHAHTTNLSLFSQLNNAKNYTEKLAIIKADSFDAQAVNSEGLPVLCYAIDNNYCYDHVQAIIRHKTFNPNQNDLIFHAFEHKACYDHIQSILKHPQFNPNQTDQSGLSIILHAIKQRACYDHVQSILKHPQFNPNQTDKHNKSLLLVACEQ